MMVNPDLFCESAVANNQFKIYLMVILILHYAYNDSN